MDRKARGREREKEIGFPILSFQTSARRDFDSGELINRCHANNIVFLDFIRRHWREGCRSTVDKQEQPFAFPFISIQISVHMEKPLLTLKDVSCLFPCIPNGQKSTLLERSILLNKEFLQPDTEKQSTSKWWMLLLVGNTEFNRCFAQIGECQNKKNAAIVTET